MTSITVSPIVFACVFGGASLGVVLRSALPAQHLSADSKDIIRLGIGLVGTMAAMVLGLLIASAKSSYDAQSNEMTQMSANAVLLDPVLAHYGPEAKESRDLLRGAVVRIRDRMWPKDRSEPSGLEATSPGGESIYDLIQHLTPKDNVERSLQAQAINIANNLGQARWLMYEQNAGSVPLPLLVVLVSWLTIIFVSFGLFAPSNATVITSLFVSALSVSCAIFLILEMYRPFEGVIRISAAPLQAALSNLGR